MQFMIVYLGKPQKKILLLIAGPLRPNPPPPSLNGRWNVGTLKKSLKKIIFSLMARPFTPPPLNFFLRLPLYELNSTKQTDNMFRVMYDYVLTKLPQNSQQYIYILMRIRTYIAI